MNGVKVAYGIPMLKAIHDQDSERGLKKAERLVLKYASIESNMIEAVCINRRAKIIKLFLSKKPMLVRYVDEKGNTLLAIALNPRFLITKKTEYSVQLIFYQMLLTLRP